MRFLSIVLLAGLMACGPTKVIPHEGAILNGTPNQAIEQCKAQPTLDWCHSNGK